MKDDLLNQIREEAICKKTETENFNNKVSRILELEQDPKVKEYSLLLKSIVGNPRYISLLDEDIYGLAFRHHLSQIEPQETNGIYVYLGAYESLDNIGSRVSEDSMKACYKRYWDIEYSVDHFVEMRFVPDFEKSNIILYGELNREMNLYREAQNLFIKTAIEQSQDEAVKLVLKKYKSNKKDTNEN